MQTLDPRETDGSHRQRKKLRQKQKTDFKLHFDYDADPPRCKNCTFFLERFTERAYWHAPLCNKGHFVVEPHAICDAWESKHGERLK